MIQQTSTVAAGVLAGLVEAPHPQVLPPAVRQSSLLLPPDLDETSFEHIPLPETLRRAVLKRRVQFRAGRHCAQRALCALYGDTAGRTDARECVPRGPSGSPLWPAGIVGSITHTDDFASAAVAWARDVGGIGIDTERIVSRARAAGVGRMVASADELALAAAAGCDDLEALTLVFSAKESIFKCLHPSVGRVFGFRDVRITHVDGERRTFDACLVARLGNTWPAGTPLDGRFELTRPWVHTAVTLPGRESEMIGSSATHNA